MDTISLYTAAWLYNPGQAPISGGGVAVRGGKILAAGPSADLISAYGPPTIEYPGCVILPGFVNAHTHLQLTRFPAWRLRGGLDYHPRRFTDWIIQAIKVLRSVTPEESRASLVAGISASLRAGTTCVGDIVALPELVSAYGETGLGGRFYLELIGQEPSQFELRLFGAVHTATEISGALRPGLSPHAPYTLHENLLPTIAVAARAESLPLALHLEESREEVDFLFDTSGPMAELLYPFVGWQQYLPAPRRITPAHFFDQGGLLGPSTLVVHCVQTTPADAALLQERGCSICLCPRSNERLAVGIAPVHLFRKLGIPLCLGTDSLASNDSLSLWDEMRFALQCYKGLLTPEELFRMATTGGAAALGMQDQVGSLEAGKRADFQVVALDGPCTAERLLAQGHLQDVVVAGDAVS